MDEMLKYLGDLHELLEPQWAGTILVLVAVVCGTVVGLERESRNKPAGIRTVSLICVGSTVFTLVSLYLVRGTPSDPSRIAAQVVTGVGFLGAGAIIRDRGTVVGLTTGATIWAVSAIGVLIGAGYAVGGLGLAVMVVIMLRGIQRLEYGTVGTCRYAHCRVLYKAQKNKTRLHVLHVLDEFYIPDDAWSVSQEGDFEVLDIKYCTIHRTHRAFLFALADLPEVEEIQHPPLR